MTGNREEKTFYLDAHSEEDGVVQVAAQVREFWTPLGKFLGVNSAQKEVRKQQDTLCMPAVTNLYSCGPVTRGQKGYAKYRDSRDLTVQ
jgi:hypothetical protein